MLLANEIIVPIKLVFDDVRRDKPIVATILCEFATGTHVYHEAIPWQWIYCKCFAKGQKAHFSPVPGPSYRIKSICVSNFNSKKCFKLQTSSNFGAKLSRNEKQHHAILCLTLDSFQAAYLSQDCGASGCPSRSCRMLFPLHVWLITLCSFLLPQCIEDYIEDYPSNYTI